MMKKRISFFLFFILAFSFLPLLADTSVKAQTDYVVDGDLVYIDDENVYIGVYPHTSSGGWVYLNFTSKRYDGNLDFLFGFNSSLSLPVKAEWYNPHVELIERTHTIHDQYFSNTTYFKANYTFTSHDPTYLYDGELFLWSKIETLSSESPEIVLDDWKLVYSQEFYEANKQTKTIYYTVDEFVEWVKLTRDKLDWKKISYEFRGMDRWFYFSHNVNEDQVYHLRIWLDVVPSLDGSTYKFWFAVKRSDQTLQQAISSDQLYFLDPWYDTDYDYAIKVTIDHDLIDSDLTDFPLMVYLNSSRINWAHVQDDLDDLRFVKSDNSTLLKYEIEDYSVNDDATLWVRTNASSSSDTSLFLYYGNDAASSGEDPENVWNSDFIAVYHLSESSGTYYDSTSNDHDLSDYVSAVGQDGQINGGQEFDGVDDMLNRTDHPDFDLMDHDFTVYGWIKTSYEEDQGFFDKHDSSSEGWKWRINENLGVWVQCLEIDHSGGTNEKVGHSTTEITTNQWNQIAMTWDYSDSRVTFFLNGSADGTDTGNQWDDNTKPFKIGHSGGQEMHGYLDEMRVINGSMSSAWMKGSYNSEIDNLLTFGVEESKPVVNDPPTNDSCSITDLDDTDDLYAQKQLYTVDYDVADLNGFADIDYCEVRFKQGVSTRAVFRYDEDTDTFSVGSGSTEWTLDGSSSASESGDYINVTLKIYAQWDATEEADLEIECYVVDDEPESDTDTMQTDYFDVITNLVTDSVECTDANDPDRVDVSSSITIDFTVRYVIEPGSSTASSFYPPDAEFTSISIYDSINNNKGTDSSIVNGGGSVTFTSESSVKSENYNLYINMADADYVDGEESTTEAVISDRIKILTLTANNTTPSVDEYVELRVTLELEYDSHTLDDGVNDVVNLVDASSPSMSWDGGDMRWEVDDVRSSPEVVTYDEVTGSEVTYGITVVNMNGKSVVVTWAALADQYYVTMYFETGLIVYINSSSVNNGSENGYIENCTLLLNGEPENTNWIFFGFERQTYNNFTVDNPIYIDLISNETIWAYSQIEGEPLLYETVWIFSLLWVCLLGFFVWNRNALLRGGTVLVGFILGLTIHSSVATTLGSLLGFVVVCVNVGLLVSVLFEK